MRPIDADELKTAFPACDNSKPVLVACVRATINHMPTIEPFAQPMRKRGKWKTAYLDHVSIGIRPKVLYCSECNQCVAYPTNFCPNCGADMRGEEDGKNS